MQPSILTPAWEAARFYEGQQRFYQSQARFKVCAAGRRSGKTMFAKRELVERFMSHDSCAGGLYVAMAPTYNQAKRIFWSDYASPSFKELVPDWFLAKKPSESELEIYGINGATLAVVGMDKPHRIEGLPIDGALVDEVATMRPEAFWSTIFPMFLTSGRPGRCTFIGRPKGRNHFFDLRNRALKPTNPDWEFFHWTSEEVLDPSEIALAKATMDERDYKEEFLADFLSTGGRAYYNYDRNVHSNHKPKYDPNRDLILCFDFNVDAGPCEVVQELPYAGPNPGHFSTMVTSVIGEVAIKRDSNTEMVCRELINKWGAHNGNVLAYGDATGGARRSSATTGTDIDLIGSRQSGVLREHFGSRLKMRFKSSNPAERSRVNAVNARLRTADGLHHAIISEDCEELIHDFEGVSRLPGSGELDKRDKGRTHWSDGFGYYAEAKFGIGKHSVKTA